MKRKLFLMTVTAAALVCSASVGTYASDEFAAPSVASAEDFSAPADADTVEFDAPEIADSDFAQDSAAADAVTPAAQDVPIDATHFPNEQFRTYLSQPERDLNKDGILQASEIKAIKTVKSDLKGIDMEGFQYLTSVEDLTLSLVYDKSNPSRALDFSSLPELKSLTVSVDNGYDYSSGLSLDLSANNKLDTLSVSCLTGAIKLPSDCNITKYSMLCDYDYDYAARPEHTALINALYGMPRLNTLSITYFKDLEGIDFSRLPELQQLNIQGYSSDDGETDSTTISSLDLSKCAKLKILDIRNAYFTKNLGSSLNINGCTSLDTLYIKDSKNLGTDAANPFISLGNTAPSNVDMDPSYVNVEIQHGGYLDLEKAGWDPALITNVEKGVLVDSRLYIDPSEGHSGEAVVSYYMNDQKTVIGQLHVSADNLYSPQAVTGLTVTKRTTGSLTCKWNQATDTYDGYALYVQDSNNNNKTIQKIMVKKGTTSEKVTGLKAGRRYHLIIRSYRMTEDGNYYSPYYNSSLSTADSYATPKTPVLKATALSKGRIQLKWTGYPTNYKNGYSRYVIEYKTSAKGAYKRLKLSGDSNGSYTLKSLKKGKTYYFRIRSYVKDTNSYVKAYSSYSKVLKIKAK